ncbi:tetratricopeptide repeat protein [Caballeronia sp. LZ062]|uniref:tetratricopeptide repeat protein n=1 Tax=unclassified Caballeronia TaxID=2646786 RepID=UPI00285B0843|nr:MULTISPECIES: tetratricopeptide repeat protein [unclassified Caballeronia]MDR5856833.1 tetratricopeptide repeat protein [Caballeronia sp. LZ050]MDR5869770.1 tetratricopeptide repeat protein [Caballeronia sp. LZ062]
MTTDADRYQCAVSHYSNARFADALQTLAPMLARRPADVDVLNLAAICAFRADRQELAEAYWRRAMEEHPGNAGSCSNLANALTARGRLTDARTLYRRAIELWPAFVEAHYNLANVLEKLGHAEEAEASYRQALRLKPDFADAHYNLANLLALARRLPEAEAAYRQALAARPRYAEAHNNLGNLLKDAGRLDEAVAQLRQAVAARPDWADALFNLGNALKARGSLGDARLAYRQAVTLRPDFAGALTNLGGVLDALGCLTDAEDAYRRVLEIEPYSADAHCNLANLIHRDVALGRRERFAEAEASYRRALALRPEFGAALMNLGNLLREDGARLAEAQALFREVLRVDPESADARLNLATALLRAGDFALGWAGFEARYDARLSQRSVVPPGVAYPQWRGEPLASKSLLVVTEQGFGDSIQFIRYLPMLTAQGAAKLTVVCPPALVALLESVDGITQCVPLDALAALPPHDYWCFLMSLPALAGTTLDTIPYATPYLHASASRIDYWRSRLPDMPKVGIAWSGEPRPWTPDSYGAFSRRWLDARQCEPLLATPGVTFVSLQKGPMARAQIGTLPEPLRPLDPMNEVADFAETAAIIASLDLVISVDTAVAHLAGALGKPVWILLCANACWRWLDARDDSPWYPSARLFRQRAPGQWVEVIERVVDALNAWRSERVMPRSP